MEWLDRMIKSIDYLEGNMEGSLDMEEVAKIACSSVFHYQRMFHMLTGFTVAEYVRKRKLTLAAQELASTKTRVLDVALKYGYDTPESFTKAFRKIHGKSPSEARVPGALLKAFPRLSFQISIKGDKDMNYRIVEKESFKVMGKAIRVSNKNGENFTTIPKFWGKCYKDGSYDRLIELAKDRCTLGICMECDEAQEEFTYLVAVEPKEVKVMEGLTEKEIPASTWAIFESVGPLPDAIQKVWQRIFSEWFPSTGYEHSGGPELEVYPEGPNDANYSCEVWIPIKKK